CRGFGEQALMQKTLLKTAIRCEEIERTKNGRVRDHKPVFLSGNLHMQKERGPSRGPGAPRDKNHRLQRKRTRIRKCGDKSDDQLPPC
ncbi:hypothetical protein L9F63_026072, partial [Diploptera punctata]